MTYGEFLGWVFLTGIVLMMFGFGLMVVSLAIKDLFD